MAKDYRYTVRIPPETATALVGLAKRHGRSLNREIVRALEDWTTSDAHQAPDALSAPATQELLERLADPAVQGFLRSAVEEAEAWTKLSSMAFARDWESDEDQVYGNVSQR